MSAQIELVQNDTLPEFGGTVDFDLTDYTVELHIDFATPLVKTGTVSNCTSTSSDYNFSFDPGDLDVKAGTYKFEIQFDNGSDGIITYQEDSDGKQLKVKIKEEIA